MQAQDDRLYLEQLWPGGHRGAVEEVPGGTVVASAGPGSSAGSVRFDAVVPARGQWSVSLLVRPVVDGEAVEPSFPLNRPLHESLPARRLRRWRQTTPIATTGDESLQRVLRRSQQDLGALRIFDPEDQCR